MDVSAEYVKMCERAWEIQVLRNKVPKNGEYFQYEEGDYIYTGGGLNGEDDEPEVEILGTTIYAPIYYERKNDQINIGKVGYDEGAGYYPLKLIWLPRQDQLQEMIRKSFLDTGNPDRQMIHFLSAWLVDYAYPIRLDSMEQLWLAFVMKEKYSKTWTGEEWG